MPLIPRVGRKTFSMRLLVAVLYVLLSMGAVTMVYPFLLMLATSVTNSTDTNEFRIVPRYFYDEAPLFAKYVDDKYAGDVETINSLYHTDFKKPEMVTPPSGETRHESVLHAWQEFVPSLPLSFKSAAFRGYGTHPSPLARKYRSYVQHKFKGDIGALNHAYTEENESFQTVVPPQERLNKRSWVPEDSPKMRDFEAWKATLSPDYLMVFSVDGLFAKYLKEDVAEYGGDLKKASRVWGALRAFDDVTLPPTPPVQAGRRRDWEEFVRTKLPLRYVIAVPALIEPYRAFLRSRYPSIDALNKVYSTRYVDFNQILLPTDLQGSGAMGVDWGEFISKSAPLALLTLDTPENRFRDFLQQSSRLATRDSRLTSPPYYLTDAAFVHANAAGLRRDYVTRNYSFVLDYILLHGRGLLVTAVFCIAVILTTLIVNPLCAYALSRYNLPYAYKVLLFLLATMAFPAEVAMIPNFLLLKELGLLNTYWALILPGAASGFSIFLLKGFFDSLPKELYEAGTIDGASETRMFFRLTLPLSKPIFAVIALQAFTGAYSAFMFAFLVCQDPKMWTLMVWLYELQINNPQYIMFAALTVAAIPTLLVFIFAQNVIMRGIILPTEK